MQFFPNQAQFANDLLRDLVFQDFTSLSRNTIAFTAGSSIVLVAPRGLSLLYTLVCQQVAESYHVKNYKDIEVPLTLALGEERERYLIDHLTGAATVYLQQWNETRFASAAVMIAFHHVLTNDQFQVVVTKALKRFSKIAPETVTTLRNRP